MVDAYSFQSGTEYTVSYWKYGTAVLSGNEALRVEFRKYDNTWQTDGTGGWNGQLGIPTADIELNIVADITTSGVWEQYSFSFVPSEDFQGRINLGCNTPSDKAVYIDDLVVSDNSGQHTTSVFVSHSSPAQRHLQPHIVPWNCCSYVCQPALT